MKHSVLWATTITVVLCCRGLTAAEKSLQLPASTVGMPVHAEQIVLPGSELEPVDLDDKSPVVLRIEAVYPHGTDFRYDFVYQGLEPGEHDLRKYLRRIDGSSTDNLPPMIVQIRGLLPPGHITPHDPRFARLPWLGGYRILIAAASFVWLLGVAWFLYPRRAASTATNDAPAPLTLADRLRPLVTSAMNNELTPAELAALERALVSYWRRRRSLEAASPVEALRQLRADTQAGPLIVQLESWLHRPAGTNSVDVTALLAPYRDLPADDFDVTRETAEAHA